MTTGEYDFAREVPGDFLGPAMAGWMQEIVPFGIFTTDRELRIVTWNQWLITHSHLTDQAVVGRKLDDIFPGGEIRRVNDRYARALEGEVSVLSTALHKYLLPFPSTVPDSGLPHMLQTARIAPLPNRGEIVGTITIIEDVTQREFQAAVLNRQQDLDRLLSDALATLLQSEDPAGEMAGIYGAIRLALGLDGFASYLLAADGKGLSLHTSIGLIPKQREAATYVPLTGVDEGLLRQHGSTGEDMGILHSAVLGELGFRSECTLPLAVGEKVIGLVVFGSYQRDHIAAADVKILSRIARYVAISMDRARRQRETASASRAKDDFLAALSHELRTPLNPVLLIASEASTNLLYPIPAREEFRVIEKNVMLEARLIDDLLDLTRIAHGKLALELHPVDLVAILRDAVQTIEPEIRERNQFLELNFGEEKLQLFGDNGRLQQVFWNVIKNAIKFTPRGGRISLSVLRSQNPNEVIVEVTDTGIGMTAAELARIFAAFSQGDHAEHGRSQVFGGLGLGLAISRELVELHAGRIEAESAGKDLGSRIKITLPVLAASEEKKKPSSPDLQRDFFSASRPPIGVTPKILLVEDHLSTRATLTILLERRGYAVTSVGSAEEALHEAEEKRFDLVLSDIGLPDEDGFSLMRKLRERYALRGIALTGYGMEDDQVKSNEAGFISHLTKPVSVQVLDRALAEVFRKS